MITKEDVEKFLGNFYVKVKVFGLSFRNDRQKNQTALAELGITAHIRERIVMDIKWHDYSDGPIIDTLNNYGEMWVFGKDFEGHEIYIKISINESEPNAICISFHEAEHPMYYPLKSHKHEPDNDR